MFTPLTLAVLMTVLADDVISIHAMSSARDIEVHLTLDQDTAARLHDADVAASDLLALTVVDEDGTPGAAMFANHEWRGTTLVLRPRYRLSAGVTYRVTARLSPNRVIEKTYRVPDRSSGPAPRVRHVFPSSSTLPANCMKFYVHFTQPMREGREIFDQIQLVDDRGDVIPHPWRRSELWNAEGDRLTLWIHPGRIKQGVNLREDFGPVLEAGRIYRLVITPRVRNLAGVPLAEPHVKEFRAVAEDHQRPDPQRWKLSGVRAGSRDPLVVRLDESLDRALLMRMLKIVTGTKQLGGSITVEENERSWTFTPTRSWPEEKVILSVNERLEDLAGNTPARVFDTDLTQAAAAKPMLQIDVPKLPDQ